MRTTPKAAGLGKKGFTLIELVAALAVSAILGVILVSTVQTGIASYKFVNADMMSETEARAALSLVTVQIRQHDATDGISLLSATSLKLIDEPGPASSYSTISFEKVEGEATGALIAREYDDKDVLLSETTVAKINAFYVASALNAFDMPVFLIKITYGETGRVLEQTVVQRSAGVVTSPGGSGG